MAQSEMLLPCPFCGGDARAFEWEGYPMAECVPCEVMLDLDKWNRRAPAAVREGWVMVPREPTDVMIAVGKEAWNVNGNYSERAAKCYRAMLAAAPPEKSGKGKS